MRSVTDPNEPEDSDGLGLKHVSRLMIEPDRDWIEEADSRIALAVADTNDPDTGTGVLNNAIEAAAPEEELALEVTLVSARARTKEAELDNSVHCGTSAAITREELEEVIAAKARITAPSSSATLVLALSAPALGRSANLLTQETKERDVLVSTCL